MSRKLVKGAGALLGAGVLLAAGAASASADVVADQEVTVTVEVEELTAPGALTLTVSGTSVALAEDGSTVTERVFTGSLPEVTVTDTREAADIPADAFWYVLGSASAFSTADDSATIPASNLGWTPKLIDYDGDGTVFAGETVEGGSTGPGLVDQELLFTAMDSTHVNPEGQWTAAADLTLTTGADAEAGLYSSTVTLSLFE